MSYQTEFPDFVLDVQIPAHWKDESWHNDACPKWTAYESGADCVQVFVDYADKTKRENGPDMPRFTVSSWIGSKGEDLHQTDDFAEAVKEAMSCAFRLQLPLTKEDLESIWLENEEAARPCPDLARHIEPQLAKAICALWVKEIGLGFHPDTRGADYVPPLADVEAYDGDMRTLFLVSADPYAAGLEAMRESGLIEPMTCRACGSDIPADAADCPHCGLS